MSFKLSIFREGRAIPVGNQPSTECRWVAALQTSDYVGSASNCVGDMSRTMPADSLLTLYSVDSVNSFLSLTSRHDNPPQNASSNLCFSPLLTTFQLWQELLLGLEAFPQPSTWKQSAPLKLSWFREHAWELLFFFSPSKLKILQRTSAQRAVEAYGTI